MPARKTFEMDIQQEFRDIKKMILDSNQEMSERITKLSDRINEQNRLFERELTKLNQNMEQVLSRIADHEARITSLETSKVQNDAKSKTLGECARFGWFIARWVLGAGIVLGSVLGGAKAWQLIFPGA